MNAPSFDDLIGRSRLLITAGSGGVGKTTIAAAMGVRGALQGRRVAVLTIDPARRLANALGLSALTGELRRVEPSHFAAVGLDAPGELWAMMLDIKTTGDQMVRRFAPDAASARAILENQYYQYFSTSLAGSQEYMAVEQVRMLVEEGGFDLVVLDTPPATHALDFLDAPDRLLEGLESRPMQMLRRGEGEGLAARLARGGRGLVLRGINKLTCGPFLEELTVFLSTFGTILDALRDASLAVRALLRRPATRFFLVTTPSRGNVDEAVRFRAQLAERGFPLGGFIVNRVHRPLAPVDGDEVTLAELTEALAPALPDVPAERRRALVMALRSGLLDHERMAVRDAQAVSTLADVAGANPWTIPLFAHDVRDLRGLDRVAQALISSPLR
ncbi:MAG: ArsA family ATPase [Myxococcales bacterium]|nr:ArsA family ATPase [Myxococcales bacterium]